MAADTVSRSWTKAGAPAMARGGLRMRGGAPFVMANLKAGDGLSAISAFIEREGLLAA